MWRVVIIDDDEKVLRGMKKIIPWEEFQCEWVGEAKNGQEGIDVIEETNPDIVITDIYMPIMNGLEMIQELREKEFDGKVIILSGYSEFEHARQAMRLRIDDYLSKPASPQTIKEVLQNLVQQLEQENMEKLEYVELREKVKLYEPVAEKEWLKSLVTGTANLYDLPKTVELITDNWQGKKHVVVSVTYDESLERSTLYQTNWYLFRFATNNIIKETTTTFFSDFHYIELHSHQTALCIHFESELGDEHINDKLQQLGTSIEDSIHKYLDVQASVSIGGIKHNWRELDESLKEAMYTLSKRTFTSTAQPLSVEQMPELSLVDSKQQTLWSESMEANQQLAESIRYADEKKACSVIETFFERISDQPYNQTTAVRIGIEMWTIMTYSLFDIGIRIHDMFSEDFDLYSDLATKTSWDELADYFKEQTRHVCHHQQWDENMKHRQLVEQMIDYVQKHLSENITLQEIADELYISRNYLGQIFKKVVGESFKNYITRVRMEKAKKMIQEGNHLIYEVSEKVGYVNPAYFTTTFKKYTGYTPTDLIHKKSISE
ncbi:response regulator transcription factor [Halalkalibacter urbisdiaboli]|uniref:response regulator transcription factor n=1 Tax=Halalkalibacter urbisdiaboli TaxID=1960589 RepID=UPI000B445E3D|nr:response regulator transcription factor [Halalkalibacter urbisdiaboli]